MPKKYYFLLSALVILAVLIYLIARLVISPPEADQMEVVQCGNKPVAIYKNPEKIFPTIVRNYQSRFNMVTGLLNRLGSDSNSGVSAETMNTAISLRDTLNQENIFFETNLKGFFLASNSDPCNDSLRNSYARYLVEMGNKVAEMNLFLKQISVPPTDTTSNIDSVIAVVDTAKGTIDTGTVKPHHKQLLIIKNDIKLKAAMDNLKGKYPEKNRIKTLPKTSVPSNILIQSPHK